MNHLLYIFFIAIMVSSCESENSEITTDLINNPNSASGEYGSDAMPKIVFEEEYYDFGDISQGEKVEHSFTFKNTGNAALIISDAVGACGCTIPSFPKEPVQPGEEADILVVFNSNGKQGAQHKRITIMANTNPNNTIVAIMANVLVPDNKTEE